MWPWAIVVEVGCCQWKLGDNSADWWLSDGDGVEHWLQWQRRRFSLRNVWFFSTHVYALGFWLSVNRGVRWSGGPVWKHHTGRSISSSLWRLTRWVRETMQHQVTVVQPRKCEMQNCTYGNISPDAVTNLTRTTLTAKAPAICVVLIIFHSQNDWRFEQ